MPFSFPSLKGLCFFMNPLVPISQFLSKLSCIWLRDGAWSQTKCHINRKARLSTEHEVVGAEPCGWVLKCSCTHGPMFQPDPSTLTSSPWVMSQTYWSEWNWTFHTWPLVCRWYRLVCIFRTPINTQRLATNWLSKFRPWSVSIFSGRP